MGEGSRTFDTSFSSNGPRSATALLLLWLALLSA